MVIYSKSGGNRENSSSVRQKRRSQTEYYSPVGTAAKGTKRKFLGNEARSYQNKRCRSSSRSCLLFILGCFSFINMASLKRSRLVLLSLAMIETVNLALQVKLCL